MPNGWYPQETRRDADKPGNEREAPLPSTSARRHRRSQGPAVIQMDCFGLYVEHVSGRAIIHRHVGGYTVSASQDDGVTYAFTGDTDDATLVRLAATAHFQ